MENKTFILKGIWAIGFTAFLITSVIVLGSNEKSQAETKDEFIVGREYSLNGFKCILSEMEFSRYSWGNSGNMRFQCE
jgi:hypothetical protein